MRTILWTLLVSGLTVGCASSPATTDGANSEIRQPQFLAISVADADGTARWYEEAFGLDRFEDRVAPDGMVHVVNLRSDGLLIELIEHREARSPRELGIERAFLAHGVFKVGFFVEDLETTVERLESQGVRFRGGLVEFPEHGVRTILVLDPEDNVIQLFEPLEP